MIDDINMMLKIAQDYFGDTKVVSIGTKHRFSNELTILINGVAEFNSFKHRRDAWDIMLKHNLYVLRLANGTYQAGVHESDDYCTADTPTEALSMVAYRVVTNGTDSK